MFIFYFRRYGGEWNSKVLNEPKFPHGVEILNVNESVWIVPGTVSIDD